MTYRASTKITITVFISTFHSQLLKKKFNTLRRRDRGYDDTNTETEGTSIEAVRYPKQQYRNFKTETIKTEMNRPLHGSNGLVYTDAGKVQAFVDILKLIWRTNNHPDEGMDHIDNMERKVHRYYCKRS